MKKQRVLIIDDSPFIRKLLSDWISEQPDLEVAGLARNGELGIQMAKELKPDVITLDVEMPVMTGLEALSHLVELNIPILMCSSVTTEGATATMTALDQGAYDFVTKPEGGASLKFRGVKDELLDKIRAARYVTKRKKFTINKIEDRLGKSDKILLIASSTGGPSTVAKLFEALPRALPVPIVIVQHMPKGFTASFAQRLNDIGTVACREAVEGDPLIPGQALIAPGGIHLKISHRGRIRLEDGDNLHGVKPAADYLFQSGAENLGNKCIGLVLTGMGKDGAEGAVAIRKAGGYVLGENAQSCVVYGMPKAAKEAGGIDQEFSLEALPGEIVKRIKGSELRNAS